MKYILVVLVSLISFYGVSQEEINPCSQWEETEKLFERFPEQRNHAKKKEAELEKHTQEYSANKTAGDDYVYIIPIVYHVIYESAESNISDEQIYSSIEVLNRDFRLLNTDYLNAPEQFSSIAADIRIEFRLAKIDPDGNCTKGINRIQSALTHAGDSEMKELITWPRNKYLNIWVCTEAGGAAGYTYLPSSTDGPWLADEDGIVLLHTYTGAIGTSNNSNSRTLSHEVGHWLNLSHTWGGTNNPGLESNCNDDDNVSDTPLTTGHSGTCNQSLETCGSLDNINNYMEYTPCKWMFTEGQKTRMRAAVTSSVSQRNQLWQESNLINTGVFNEEELCEAEFRTDNDKGCVDQAFVFTDESFHGVTTRTWDFGDGNTYTTNDPEETEVTHAYESPGLYTISLTIGDGNNELTETKESLITVFDPSYVGESILEGFETGVDPLLWTIENPEDDFGWETTSIASLTGNSSLRLRNKNVNIYDAKDMLISSVMDITENEEVYLTYNWAFTLQNEDEVTDDRLKVLISYNCGETWVTKKVHRGTTDLPSSSATSSNFIPTNASQWKSHSITIDNPTQITSSFQVKFEFLARGGNHIYLDDINIFGNSTSSVDDLNSTDQTLLFPNPVSGMLTINIPTSFDENAMVNIHDISGRMVKELSQSDKRFQFDASQLTPGVYFVSIVDNSGRNTTSKLIVQ